MTKCFHVFPLFMEVFRSWLPTFSTAARASLVETLAPGRVSGRFLLGKRMKQHSSAHSFQSPQADSSHLLQVLRREDAEDSWL